MADKKESFSDAEYYQVFGRFTISWRCSMSRILAANTDQLCLVPSNPGCWLPVDHPVRFFNEMIEEDLDLSGFRLPTSTERHGRPSYDPVMLLKVVLYGYMMGIHTSRELAKACVERIDFRFLTGGLIPSFSTISKFRADHADALAGLFAQSVAAATKDELIEVGDVAFDGTKILANASKHKAMRKGSSITRKSKR